MIALSRDGNILRCTAVIDNQRGLHARAAAKFVKLAAGFDAEITVTKAARQCPGRSILGLMMLARRARHRDGDHRRRPRGGRSHRGARRASSRPVSKKIE